MKICFEMDLLIYIYIYIERERESKKTTLKHGHFIENLKNHYSLFHAVTRSSGGLHIYHIYVYICICICIYIYYIQDHEENISVIFPLIRNLTYLNQQDHSVA